MCITSFVRETVNHHAKCAISDEAHLLTLNVFMTRVLRDSPILRLHHSATLRPELLALLQEPCACSAETRYCHDNNTFSNINKLYIKKISESNAVYQIVGQCRMVRLRRHARIDLMFTYRRSARRSLDVVAVTDKRQAVPVSGKRYRSTNRKN